MKVIPADHERRYEIPGVPVPARRPVDIDVSQTGFTRLLSLRLYRFNAGSVIDGHAEEDEVFVVVTSGSVEMKIGIEGGAFDGAGVYTLSAPTAASTQLFVAYLPPHAVYQLIPHTAADVAYARATPIDLRAPAVFGANGSVGTDGVATLLEELTHAGRLRVRVVQVKPRGKEVTLDLPDDADAGCETLVHVQSSPAENMASISGDDQSLCPLQSWQTAALGPGDRAVLRLAPEATALVLTVSAA